MKYRLDKKDVVEKIRTWNGFLRRKIHLIACGGTALTLIGVKDSTKDIDFIVPKKSDYKYLTGILNDLGYKPVSGWGWSRGDPYIFDLFPGKKVHTTELLESPLNEKNHQLIKEFSRIYIGVLNYYDLIISKLIRGDTVDFQDCLSLIKARKEEINLNILTKRFRNTSQYDVAEERVNESLKYFLEDIEKEGIYE